MVLLRATSSEEGMLKLYDCFFSSTLMKSVHIELPNEACDAFMSKIMSEDLLFKEGLIENNEGISTR